MSTAVQTPPATTPPASPAGAGKVVTPPPSVEANVKSLIAKNMEAKTTTPPAEVKTEVKTEVKPGDQKPAEKAEKTSIFDKVKKPETKTEEAKVEADPLDAWKLPDNASPESVKNFSEIRAEAKKRLSAQKEAEKRLQEATQQLETYRKASPADAASTEALKAQLKEAQDRLAIYDLRNHPDFVKQYSEPKNRALSEAKEVLTYNGKEVGDLSTLLDKPLKDFNAAVASMTKDMNSMDSTTVQTALRQAHKLHHDENGALGKASELSQQIAQRGAQLQKNAFEEVSKQLGPMGDFLTPLEVPQDATPENKTFIESYNQAVAQVRANAEKIAFSRVDEKGMAAVAYKAATMDFLLQHTLPRMEAEFRQLAEAHAQLAQEAQALRGGKGPSGLAKSNASSATDGKPDISKMSMEDGVKALLHQKK